MSILFLNAVTEAAVQETGKKGFPVLPFIMLALCLLAGVGWILYEKVYLPKKKQQLEDEEENAKQSTWEFINVKDIGENAIYTVDNKIISVYSISPINIDLMTDTEKENAINTITAGISNIREPYKILSIQKPYDIAPYIADLMRKYKQSDETRKRIIMKEVAALNELGSKNEITDRQCFLVYWCENDNRYDKKRSAIAKCFADAGVNLDLLNTKQLIRLCNMVYNPSFKTDVSEATLTVPLLNM